jgi:hypothetical protein
MRTPARIAGIIPCFCEEASFYSVRKLAFSLGLQAPVLSLPWVAALWIIRHDSYSARFYKAGYSCMAYPVWF